MSDTMQFNNKVSQRIYAGLVPLKQEVVVLFNPTWSENTFSYHLIGLIDSFMANRYEITREEVQAWTEDLRQVGEAQTYFFSLNRYLFLATRS